MTHLKASLKLTHTRLPESVTMTQVFFRLQLVLADHLTTDKKLSIQDFLSTLWELYSKLRSGRMGERQPAAVEAAAQWMRGRSRVRADKVVNQGNRTIFSDWIQIVYVLKRRTQSCGIVPHCQALCEVRWRQCMKSCTCGPIFGYIGSISVRHCVNESINNSLFS